LPVKLSASLIVEKSDDYLVILKLNFTEPVNIFINFDPERPSFDRKADFALYERDELTLDPKDWKELSSKGAFIFFELSSHSENPFMLRY